MSNHRTLSHSSFSVVLQEFLTKTDGNAEAYGLAQDLVDEIKTVKNTLEVDIDDQALKAADSKAATTKTNQTRKTADSLYAKAKRLAKESGVLANKLAEINFETDDLPSSLITPQTPLDLLVEGFSNGKNTLKWNRNGNKSGTIFLIEAKIGAAADFIIVGTSTRATFNHLGQTPGVKIVYRVRAQRGELLSEFSNDAVIYNS